MSSSQARRTIAAGMIGNVLEWYDFAVYGFFAAVIGQEFFPHQAVSYTHLTLPTTPYV